MTQSSLLLRAKKPILPESKKLEIVFSSQDKPTLIKSTNYISNIENSG